MIIQFQSLSSIVNAGMHSRLPVVCCNLVRSVGGIPAGNKCYVVNPKEVEKVTLLGRTICGHMTLEEADWKAITALRIESVPSVVVSRCWTAGKEEMEAALTEAIHRATPQASDFSPDIDFSDLLGNR